MDMQRIGIRAETKSEQELRAPLTPKHIRMLYSDHNITAFIQPSDKRAFKDCEYAESGAVLDSSLAGCSLILGVKELLAQDIFPEKAYLIFSHTTKGQHENMAMLKTLIEKKCTLLDYELVVNEKGKRLVFFGRFAGYAGMIDTLAVLGRRLKQKNVITPFSEIKQAFQYGSLTAAKTHISLVGEKIAKIKLPAILNPFVCGFAGYGNVSSGAQEIYDLLTVQEISPQNMLDEKLKSGLYKTVFYEKDMFAPNNSQEPFQLQKYFNQPHKFHADFKKYLPFLSILINGIYWESKYPRLVTKADLLEIHPQKLQVIGDISCDLNGAIEITQKSMRFENPAFVYNIKEQTISADITGDGIAVMAVDHLPSEFPKESSQAFGDELINLLPELCQAHFPDNFVDLLLSPKLKNAIILYKGKLTPKFQYLEQFVSSV